MLTVNTRQARRGILDTSFRPCGGTGWPGNPTNSELLRRSRANCRWCREGVIIYSRSPWRGGRVVEGAGLENRYIRKGIAGSNPALSATIPPSTYPARRFYRLAFIDAASVWAWGPGCGRGHGEGGVFSGVGSYGDGAPGPPCQVSGCGHTQPRPPLLRMRTSLSPISALVPSTVPRSPSLIPDRYGARTCRVLRARLTAPPGRGLSSWGMAMGPHGVLGSLALFPQPA